MKKFRKYSVRALVIFGAAVLVTYPLFHSAGKDDQIQFEILSSNAPVAIMSFSVGDKIVKSKDKLDGSEPWLEQFKINVANKSGKTIKYIDFGVFFPRSNNNEKQKPLYYVLRHGDKAAALRGSESGIGIPSVMDEKQLVALEISGDDRRGVYDALDDFGYSKRNLKIQIQIDVIVFDDGTVWSAGSWYRVNPNDPDNLIRMDGKKGEAIESFALNDLNDNCLSPIYGSPECLRVGDNVCSARDAGLAVPEPPTHRVVDAGMPCLFSNGQSCGLNGMLESLSRVKIRRRLQLQRRDRHRECAMVKRILVNIPPPVAHRVL